MKMAQSEVFVGIDVSKAVLDVAIWPGGASFQVSQDREGRQALVRRLKAMAVSVVGLEASGGFERPVMKALFDAGLTVRRVNPWRVRRFAEACGVLAKNDRADARVIARFVATLPDEPTRPNPQAEKLAELVTLRRQLTDDLTRAKNQAAHAGQALIKRLAQRRIQRLKLDILLLDKAIHAFVAEDPDMARKNALLRSVPCVGPVFAHTLLALMPELGGLTNRQAAALLGVAPYDCESGQFRGQRRIFGGRRAVRDVAYMAAIVAGQVNPVFKQVRTNLLAAGKKPKVVIVAIMRRLITTLNAILRDNTPWKAA